MIGKTIAHYKITSLLGKGGMGEVYQAKDTKLGREVAIKVLPEEFARDADRVVRFQREAKLLAALNHPNIAAIYGLEESDGTNFLVMELIEGQPLVNRIKSGPIPVEEALKLALQIAEALEAAHENGVIHRDLKPSNIKVTPDGKVKILDFGLAKAFAEDQGEVKPLDSPTVSAVATRQGVILGTAAYMSPEQARGKPIDKRTDIWAFGVVLFEMLTGRSLFAGEDVSSTLAKVLERQPDYSALTPDLHPRIRFLLERCLEKEAKNRYSSISDARVEIQKVISDPGVVFQSIPAVRSQKKLRIGLSWIAAALVLSVVITGITVWKMKPALSPEPDQVMRFEYELPEGQQFSNLTPAVLAISPDGKQIVYCTNKGIYLRSMDQLVAKMIPGTEENTNEPLFSPDGKWIGYFSIGDKKWKKIPVSGGTPVILCDADDPQNASWGADDQIVYAELENGGIMRISANGGTPELIVKKIGLFLVNPQVLPDKKTVLFCIVRGFKTFQIAVQSLKSGKPRVLFEGSNGRYLSTGHIVYGVRNSLFAVPFNLERLEVSGGPVPLIEDVFRLNEIYTPQYAVSDSGTLVYIEGKSSASAQRTLVWVDRKGKEVPLSVVPNDYSFPRISPDGTKVALNVGAGEKSDIWIWDTVRETMSRLTFDGHSAYPLWTPDGKRIAFSKMTSALGRSPTDIYWKASDGTGEDEKLGSASGRELLPWSWSSDGNILALSEFNLVGETSFDVGTMSMKGYHEWKPLLDQKYVEDQPKISPDGRWMAYTSNESGHYEIYVRPFPDVNRGRWQVSTDGGDTLLWSPDGREIFYRKGDSIMAVSVEMEPAFRPGKPEVLFQGNYVTVSRNDLQPWDINPDGKRFLMLKEVGSNTSEAGGPRKIVVVTNWFEELKERVPVD